MVIRSEAKFRITLTIGTLETGGAQRILSLLANRWAGDGHPVSLITLNGLTECIYPLDKSIKTTTAVPMSRRQIAMEMRTQPWTVWKLVKYCSPYVIRHAWELREKVKQNSPDVVLSFIDGCNALTLLALLGSSRAKVVAEMTDPAVAPLHWIWRLLRRLLYWTADRVVVQTAAAAEFFKKSALRNLTILPSPVVVPDTSAASDIEVVRPAIVSLGRLAEEKRLCDLIDAFALIAPHHPDWSLYIVGEGPMRPDLERQIANLGLDGRVHLPGVTKNAGGVLIQADIFALSSRFEGFPTALCEAMALGKPVVSTDCRSGPREIVRDGIDGILVPPLSPKDMASAFERLIRDTVERQEMGAAAADVATRFNPETVFAEWDRILSTAIESRGAS